MTELKNKSEILFLYDVRDANPNGDPMDENKPRIDEYTGVNLVTDVRLKRFIRDYLRQVKGLEIFVIEKYDDEGKAFTAKQRAADFDNDPDKIKSKCIDVRLFGGVIPIGKGSTSITFTGPVQFNMGRSLHRVEPVLIQGTGAFASKEGQEQKTFREEWIVHYSLIAFHGIVNQIAAKDTGMTEEDRQLLIEALWEGLKNETLTRSKIGHMPRFLFHVLYKEGDNFYIGELDKRIKLISEKDDLQLRGPEDYVIDVTDLVNALKEHSNHIEKIEYKADKNIRFAYNGSEAPISEIFANQLGGLRIEHVSV